MLRIGQIEVTAQNNKYTDGNVAGGIPATRLRAAALNAFQEELAGIVEGAGLTLDPEDFGQVLKALKRLFAAKTESLGALAALTGAKDKLPYFTGADAATLTDLTSVGRDILASATKTAVLEYLGLGDMQTSLKYGAPLIGELIMWSRPEMPQEWWPDCGMEFIPYMGQSFDPVRYPILASIHSNATLSADMRGMFPRGWDNTRGIDPGRPIMNEQGDAMRNFTGTFGNFKAISSVSMSGPFSTQTTTGVSNASDGGAGPSAVSFDPSRVVPTANENRPKNVAWNFIVRAK